MDTTVPIYYSKQEAMKQFGQERATPKVERKGCALYRVIKPFIFCLRLIGGFPYTIHNETIQFRFCSWWTFYSAVVMSLQILFLFLTTHAIFIENNNKFDNKVFSVINIIIIISQICGPLTFWFEVPGIVRYLLKWSAYQKELHLCGVALDAKLEKWVRAFLLLSIPYIFASSYYQSMVHGGLIHMPTVILLHLNTYLCLSIWFFCVFFIHSTSHRLIKRFRLLAQTRDGSEIAACRRSWLTLADLTTELGNVMGPTLLEILLIASALVIINCYILMFIFRGAIMMDEEGHRSVTAGRIFFIIAMSIIVIVLCEFGYSCTNAVGSNLLQKLLRMNASPQEREFQREVTLFIQTIWLRYPNMMLCGFLTLNRRLLVSLISGGITYLIVLLQFRSSEGG